MMKLILVRHGETDWNNERRYQGQYDVPLNSNGKWQARQVARALAAEPIEKLFSSDLQRALVTAEAIAAACDIPVTKDRRLREKSFGRWEGLTVEQIKERDGDAYARWRGNPAANAPTGGETLEIARRRVLSLWEEIRAGDLQTVALVSHGGTLRILLCHLLDLPPESFWQIKMGNTAVSRLQIDDAGVTLDVMNDMRHLQSVSEH